MTNIVSQRPTPPPMARLDAQVKLQTHQAPLALQQLPIYTVINAEVIANTTEFITEVDSIYGKLCIKTNLNLMRNTKITLQVLRVVPQLELIIKDLNNIPINALNLSTNLNELINTAHESSLKIQNSSHISASNSIPVTGRSLETPINLTIGSKLNAILIRPIEKKSIIETSESKQNKSVSVLTNNDSKINTSLSASHKTTSQIPISSNKSNTGPVNLIVSGVTKNKIKRTAKKTFQQAKSVFSKVQAKVLGFGSEELSAQHQFSVKKPQDHKKYVPEDTALLTAGTRFGIKFHGISDAHTKNVQHLATIPNSFKGTIIAETPTGQPILSTPLGMIVIETPALLLGKSMRLEIIPDTIMIPVANSALSRFESIFQSRQWPNLADAINELSQGSTIDVQKLITSTLPQANPQLTSNTLFFLNALKGGDIRSWLGNTTASILDQIKPELLIQLNEDFALLGRAVMEPQLNDWRSALIPFFTAMGLEQFQMHTQQHAAEGQDKEQKNCSRFIIDILLSKLGRFQIDGLVRAKGKRLDLVLRSEDTLPQQMRRDINNIFTNFTVTADVIGQIIFQADQPFVEVLMPQLADHPNTGLII